MKLDDLNRAVGDFIRKSGGAPKGMPTGVPGLCAFERETPTPIESTLYQPIVCLTLQGVKETVLGDKVRLFQPGGAAIVSHDLPVASQIIEASPAQPYRSLVLLLDLGVLRSLYDQLGDEAIEETEADAIAVGAADDEFVDAIARYFALADKPVDAQVLAPLIQRELHFRLLTARHGGMLRRLLDLDSYASRIARAIAHIRQHFREPIAIADLAKSAGMSASSFHAHFRAIAETTPLQYQKELRLIEAKRLLSEEAASVSAAAYEVGYESPTQFSREYSRMFGVTPRNDRPVYASQAT